MRTLLFTLEYPPFHGGVANYYGNLVKYWPAFAPRSGASADKPAQTPEGADDIFVLNNNDGRLINKHWPFLNWLASIGELKKQVNNLKIDRLIIGNILPLGTAGIIFRLFYPIKYSVILHGMDFTYATKIWRKKIISKIILNRAEKIICANKYTAELVKKFLPKAGENKIITVNPGAEGRAAHNEPLIRQLKKKYNLNNNIILLSVGRLVKRKGFDKVIAVMPTILKQSPNLVYIIIGDGQELKNLNFQISNLKLNNSIFIISNTQDDERNGWYDLSDIFIMTARNINGDFEGFGMVYLEANLAGKPIIAGRSGGVGDAVIHGLNGLLVDPEDNDAISQAIIKLANDPELRQKLGQQGKERALTEFNWQKQAEKIYNSLISNYSNS